MNLCHRQCSLLLPNSLATPYMHSVFWSKVANSELVYFAGQCHSIIHILLGLEMANPTDETVWNFVSLDLWERGSKVGHKKTLGAVTLRQKQNSWRLDQHVDDCSTHVSCLCSALVGSKGGGVADICGIPETFIGMSRQPGQLSQGEVIGQEFFCKLF